MFGDAALGARHHQILDAHICKRAAHHHLMIAASRTVAVKVRHVDAPLLQVNAGGRGSFNRARGTDVIGGD